MILEPTHSQDAGGLGVGDALAVAVQFNVVADATAEGAGRVFRHGQFHSLSPLLAANLAVRTGRNHKRSAEGAPLVAAANAPRHVAPGFNLFPRLDLVRLAVIDEVRIAFDAAG